MGTEEGLFDLHQNLIWGQIKSVATDAVSIGLCIYNGMGTWEGMAD